MRKSQISIFIVMGLVVLITAGIVFYIRGVSVEKTEVEPAVIMEVPFEREAIIAYIRDCINQESKPLIEELGRQGGTLNRSYPFRVYPGIFYTESNPYRDPVTGLTATDLITHYYPVNYTYFCVQQGNSGCVNSLITRKTMEEELNNAIREGLDSCINLEQFEERGYNVVAGSNKIKTTIASEEVNVLLNFPITISKEGVSLEIDNTASVIKSDLGKLYDLAVEITNKEITLGYFDEDDFMGNSGGEVQIEKHKPYPDTIYSLKKYNKDTNQEYVFNFAIMGRDSVSHIGLPSFSTIMNPYCNMLDGNCYANSDPAYCIQLGGISSATPECGGASIYVDGCVNCNDCGAHKHGDSWCVYDSIVGDGYDYVGSRHYKQTCINGRIYDTECRDFREELCTEDPVAKKAVCRINRWHDCAEQTDRIDCEDNSKRDCTWSEWLVDEATPSYGLQRKNRRCHPQVPPGFRFWEGHSEQVCNVANEWRRCDGYSCPLVWTEAVMQYCYFQGDCGDYRNVADEVSITHYNVEEPRDYIYLDDGLTNLADSPDNKLGLPLYNRAQDPLGGNEFSNSQGNYEAIFNAANDWFEEASSWEVCDFCECVGDAPTGGCVFDESIFSTVICRPWGASISGEDCGKCGEDPLKPCTEYMCKSLGSKCVYEQNITMGLGVCYEYSELDRVGPKITYDGSVLGDFTVEADSLIGIDADGYWICNGDSCDDAGIDPYSILIFVVNLSEEAQCKLSPLPDIDYEDIPSFGVSGIYDKLYPILMRVYSFEDAKKQVLDFAKLDTVLSLSQLGRIETQVTKMKQDAIDIANEFNQPIDEAELNQMEADFRTYTVPNLRDFYDQMGYAIQEILVQMESRNVILFLKCQDRAGNENEREFFVKYTIGEDRTAPLIIKLNPPNATAISGSFRLVVSLNEPSICKYSIGSDKSYETMDQTMDCAISEFDANFGLYECSELIPDLGSDVEIYVKCADQPPITRRYNLHLLESTEFSVESEDYSNMIFLDDLYTINVTNDLILRNNNTKINVRTNTVTLNLFMDEESDCRYNESYVDFNAMGDTIICNPYGDKYLCSQSFAGIPGNRSYYIGCRDVAVSTPNINSGSYFLKYFRT
jgi:hypothetical protein